MPSDITGHAVLDPKTMRDAHRARPGLHPPAARRRDQSRARQDAERAARGDAGVPGHARRPDATAAEALHGARHAEPGGDRRHLSAARSAARPLPVQDRDRLSLAGRRSRRRGPRDHRPGGRRAAAVADVQPCSTSARSPACRPSPRGSASTSRSSTTPCASCAPRATGRGSRRAPVRAARWRWCAARAPSRCSKAATS